MNAPPATATRDAAASLAGVLAGALSLGLPAPDYITLSPDLVGSKYAAAVGFQFNDRHGQAPLAALYAWAERFGVKVAVETGYEDPTSTWHQFDFEHRGVRFHAYAEIKAPAPCGAEAEWSARACTREAGHDGWHVSHIGDRIDLTWEDPEPAPVTGRDVLLSALADDTTGSAA